MQTVERKWKSIKTTNRWWSGQNPTHVARLDEREPPVRLPSQDWKPIILREEKGPKYSNFGDEEIGYFAQVGQNKNTVNITKLEKKLDDGYIPQTVTKNMARQISEVRNSLEMPDGKSMTQEDLAKACNLPVNIIRDYENGTVIPRPGEISIIASVLKVKLNK